MREKAIEQFESIFERAAIPVLQIDEIALKRISLVLAGDALDETGVQLAGHLRTRFGVQIRLHGPAAAWRAVQTASPNNGFEAADAPAESTAALIGQIALAHSQLVIVAEPPEPTAGFDTDALVSGTASPILFVRTHVDEPQTIFERVLHSLSGNFQQTQNFSYSFTLVADDGALRLLHAIDPNDIAAVREAMQVSPDVSIEDEQQILEQLKCHGERYLKAVVAASREQPYDVSYELRFGDVVSSVQAELARESYGLLVVGHHAEGHSHTTADDYQLLHLVRDVPVLAL